MAKEITLYQHLSDKTGLALKSNLSNVWYREPANISNRLSHQILELEINKYKMDFYTELIYISTADTALPFLIFPCENWYSYLRT